jgi:hypothetical protein
MLFSLGITGSSANASARYVRCHRASSTLHSLHGNLLREESVEPFSPEDSLYQVRTREGHVRQALRGGVPAGSAVSDTDEFTSRQGLFSQDPMGKICSLPIDRDVDDVLAAISEELSGILDCLVDWVS